MTRDDNFDQPPGVDVSDPNRQYPDPGPAAERILEFVAWFGDGDIAGGRPGPALYARDLESVAREVLEARA